ncbi:MAG: metalloregulator ArsR/SmtB family transcription factor [Anaerolineaceae bacterium]|nr:metalloregulator ArsR/SmtB family transcription factor [Anaerolineaceae bacterium]
MEETILNELLQFFKALNDANRLKIVGLLSQEDLSVEQMAEMLKISSSTVSHHLGRLSKAGLVSARSESYYNIYHLETNIIEEMSARLLAKETLPKVTENVDMDAYQKKIVKNYSNPDGTLKLIPYQRKKFQAILDYILPEFTPGQHYSEQEVNDRLAKYHEDYAYLRRGMIEYRYLDRTADGTDYWRPEN